VGDFRFWKRRDALASIYELLMDAWPSERVGSPPWVYFKRLSHRPVQRLLFRNRSLRWARAIGTGERSYAEPLRVSSIFSLSASNSVPMPAVGNATSRQEASRAMRDSAYQSRNQGKWRGAKVICRQGRQVSGQYSSCELLFPVRTSWTEWSD
jgi:hypothetical protein